VCHGNIIRSAAAAALLQDELSQSGIDTITVESGGTRTRVGRPADPRADAAVRRFGVSLEQHRSQPLTRELVGRADVIFVMDDMNLVDVLTEFPEARSKTLLLGGLDTIGAHRRYHGVAIEDPYSGAPAAVASTIDRVRACVVSLAGVLAREQNVHVLR
jgi:protein-tyrosine phosphatase